MTTPSPQIPRIQKSPRGLDLWIPCLKRSQEPHGRVIQVEWNFCTSVEVEVRYRITDEPYLTGHEYAGDEPLYLTESDEYGEGVFLLRTPSILFSWWHDAGMWRGRAIVAVIRTYLDELSPATEISVEPKGRTQVVMTLAELRQRRAFDKHRDPIKGGPQDE